ncbi:uncharacterized protein LMH87_007708 [Akanthomyces muscarius]|uniref:Uncharacterized protein n=1 Tax=Akanthomyces muscarius TaxID=2231603 RepID=A0A9W8QMP3_AKAMU|nr:uncharacterized protein LMH87_007708 [Akanthomyces muscarius]KAJ4161683.1 hypothetical protein LMH87_007708 [Akanthomyces muscarius]
MARRTFHVEKSVYFVIVVDELPRRLGERNSRSKPTPSLLTDPVGRNCFELLWVDVYHPSRIYTGASEKCGQSSPPETLPLLPLPVAVSDDSFPTTTMDFKSS